MASKLLIVVIYKELLIFIRVGKQRNKGLINYNVVIKGQKH